MDVRGAVRGHPDTGEHKEPPEDVDHPVEGVEQGQAAGDESGPKDEGAQHAPQEDAVLVDCRNGEETDQQGEDEHVVDRERALDGVARQVFAGGLRSLPEPRDRGEPQPQHEPRRTPPGGLP